MAKSVQALEVFRLELGISQQKLATAASLHLSNYRRALGGERKLRQSTQRRIEYALQRFKRFEGQDVPTKADLTYRLCVAMLCMQAGLSPARVLSHKPSDRRTADKEWAQAALIRRQAIYLANTTCGVPQADLARATNMTRAAVSLALNDVEDSRDNPNVEQLFLVIEEAILS